MIDLAFATDMPIAVFGLGRSGLSAARALHAVGAVVLAWDDNPERRQAAVNAGVPLTDLYGIDWSRPRTLVLAPGIPHHLPQPHPIAALARNAGCEIVGDIALLGRAAPNARYIGITGTNGKSTTTALIGHILAEAGRDTRVGGNLGPPVADFTPVTADTDVVLEMSSYQLERTPDVHFDVAVFLNLSPDHLDRHGGLDGYIAAKRRIFDGQPSSGTAIVGVDDEVGLRIAADLDATAGVRVLPISSTHPVPGGVYVQDAWLIDDRDGRARAVLDLRAIATLPGVHNGQNAAAAFAAACAAGVDVDAVAAGMRTFPGLAHRQELVATRTGVTFINDSKATNADAALRALTSHRDIYWIAGGRAKDGGLSGTESGWANVRRAFLIGECAESFRSALVEHMPAEICGDLDTAVRAAFKRARDDGAGAPIVLFAPAAASFDQYADFEARGDAFKRAVFGLTLETDRDLAAGGVG
jgi:UDP-N-acetylmuramoylalanine--D-glutamate ligase